MIVGQLGGMPWITKIWMDKTLVAGSAFIESAWVDVSACKSLYVAKISVGAQSVYALQIDWRESPIETDPADMSIPHVLNDMLANDTNVKTVVTLMPYIRFRISNTGTGAFTSHCTRVTGIPLTA